MREVNPNDVERIARLAALDVDSGELPALAAQISAILGYVSQLGDRDPGDASVDIWSLLERPQPLRADGVRTDAAAIRPEEFAPAFEGSLFLVPKLDALDDK